MTTLCIDSHPPPRGAGWIRHSKQFETSTLESWRLVGAKRVLVLWQPKEVSSCGEVYPQSRLAGAACAGDLGAARRKDPDRTSRSGSVACRGQADLKPWSAACKPAISTPTTSAEQPDHTLVLPVAVGWSAPPGKGRLNWRDVQASVNDQMPLRRLQQRMRRQSIRHSTCVTVSTTRSSTNPSKTRESATS
jgi:hypothetical protein